jgi:hypothetical protein
MTKKSHATPQSLSAPELAEKYGISRQMVEKLMLRHGYKKTSGGKYIEAEFLSARKAGAMMDKTAGYRALKAVAGAGVNAMADDPGDPPSVLLLKRKVRRADIDIKAAQFDLDKSQNLYVLKTDVAAMFDEVSNVVLNSVRQWIENIGAKRADADLMHELEGRWDEMARQVAEIKSERLEK